MPEQGGVVFLRLKSVLAITGMSRALVYELMAKKADDPARFPRPYKLSERAVAWKEQEVRDWMVARPRANDESFREAS